jgi:hypothetical protein
MILLSPLSKLGSVHIQSCKCFKDITDMQEFLKSITRKWDSFSICPEAFELSIFTNVQRLSDEWHELYVYPYTLDTRMKEEKP